MGKIQNTFEEEVTKNAPLHHHVADAASRRVRVVDERDDEGWEGAFSEAMR